MKKLFPFALCLLCLASRGADIYIAELAQGADTGADAADAHSLAWINTGANWPAAGAVIHLVGTFTNVLTVAGSGTQANPTTFYFESGANFTWSCWDYGTDSGGGAIQPNGSQWIVIDGGVNGLIQNTNCGTGKPNLSTSGIAGQASHWIIKNLTLTNLYERTNFVDFPSGTEGGNGVFLEGNDLTVTNCNVSDSLSLITLKPHNDAVNTNYTIVNNRLLNSCHFAGFSIPENTIISNVTIAGNLFDHADVWDGGGGANNLHLDYIINIDAGIRLTNAYVEHTCIYGNTFGVNYEANLDVITNYPGWGKQSAGVYTNATDFASHGQTAILAYYFNAGSLENRDVFMFNNLALSHTNNSWGNLPISPAGTNVWCVNNGCYAIEGNSVPCGGGYQVGGDEGFCYNNISFPGYGFTLIGITTNTVDGGNTGPNDLLILTSYLTMLWSDWNCGTVDSDGFCRSGYGVGSSIAGSTPFNTLAFNPLSDWQTYHNNEWGWTAPIWNTSHADPDTKTNAITFSSGYAPASSDTATSIGTNLTAIANAYGVPAMLKDFNGNARPAVGNWRVGPFEAITVASFTQLQNAKLQNAKIGAF